MEKIMSFVKGLFVKEDGSMNWKGPAFLVGGALLGGTGMFGLLGGEGGFSIMNLLIGAVAGLGGAAALEAVMPSSPTPASPEVTPAANPRVSPEIGRAQQPEIVPPGPMGARPPQPRGR